MNKIQTLNQDYWNKTAKEWFGCTCLPTYGVKFESEDDLKLFDELDNTTILDIGCGSGHSLKYCADKGAKELWGLDISSHQLSIANDFLASHNYQANLVNTSMETCEDLPLGHFDIIYSIYAIGWSTDLAKTFNNIYSMLKKGGSFIFSWQHALHHCIRYENDQWIVKHSYHDESYYDLLIDGHPVKLSSRKLSTYLNHLIQAGFIIEHVSESSNHHLFKEIQSNDLKSEKARLVPLSFVIKARKTK